MSLTEGPRAKDPLGFAAIMTDLHLQAKPLLPTITHHTIYQLAKILPDCLVLSQNIDFLEEQFEPYDLSKSKLVQIHGSLNRVYCPACCNDSTITNDIVRSFLRRVPVPCKDCKPRRIREGVNTGYLMPDVQLYGETHRYWSILSSRENKFNKPALVFVVGTTLGSDDGFERVKAWRKEMGTGKKKGMIIYIDRSERTPSRIKQLCDFHLVMDSDSIFEGIAKRFDIPFKQEMKALEKQKAEEMAMGLAALFEAEILPSVSKSNSKLFKAHKFASS
jgi:NAD-dependent SIR2 family protein deacetylase